MTGNDWIDDTQGTDNSAKIELHRLLNEDALQETLLLVLANKQVCV